MTFKKAVYIFVCLFFLILGMRINRRFYRPPVKVQEVEVVKSDTITIIKPVEVEKKIVQIKKIPVVKIDTCKVVISQIDTLTIHDTLYVKLPIYRKTYENKFYKAEIQGYNARLNYVKLKPQRYKKKISIGAGVGVGWNGTEITPTLNLSIYYPLFTF